MTSARQRRPLWAGVCAVVLTGLVVGSGALWAAAGPAADRDLEVVMRDYRFEPDRLSLPAGRPQRIVVVNRGVQPHEIMVGRGVHAGGGHHGYMENFFQGLSVEVQTQGATLQARDLSHIVLQPGARVTLTLTIPASRRGQWELGCFVPGHYELGMKGSLTVR